MSNITRSALSLDETIAATMTRYGVRMSPADLMLWLEDLEGIDPEAAIAAFKAHRVDPDEGKWAPKPADILRRVQGGNDEHARFAWSEVRRAVRQLGPYVSVRFADPLTPTIIGEMGGWGAICEISTFDVAKREKDFISRYMTYASRKMIPHHPLGYVRGEFDQPPVSLPAIDAQPMPLSLSTPRELPAVSQERIEQVKQEYREGIKVRLNTIPESTLRRA